MKILATYIGTILSVIVLAAALPGTENKPLTLGAVAPLSDVPLKDISGNAYSLQDLKRENGLLVIFSCNTCPFVLGWEDQYPHLGELGERNKIGVVLVNSNEAKREGDDSFDAMVAHAREKNYNTPYVVDQNSRLANRFGAITTPHVFLFDKDLKLVYKGSINDKYEQKDEKPQNYYLQNAIVSMMAGKPIQPAETRQMGCSIKRK
ncbi:redoxin domain-containing protein [bacterium]|nr:redoxin domain-containing protein [bacterium]